MGVDEGGVHALNVTLAPFFILDADSFILFLALLFYRMVAEFYYTLQYDLVSSTQILVLCVHRK